MYMYPFDCLLQDANKIRIPEDVQQSDSWYKYIITEADDVERC